MRQNKFSLTTTLLLLITLAFGLVIIGYATKLRNKPAHAASTYVVDSNGDESDDNPGDDVCHTALDTCTLRAAIEEANAHAGADIINFDNAYTMTPASAYDVITDPVEINGYTGSPGGATANTAAAPAPFNGTLTVAVDGTSAGLVDCFVFNAGSEGSSVRGLVINSFYNGAVSSSAANITVAGNYLGTDAAGTADLGNGYGVRLLGSGVTGNTIGGTAAADRNIISGNGGYNIEVSSAGTGNTILGNYIGVATDGTSGIGSDTDGIHIVDTSGVTVGGSTAAAANVISDNGGHGIFIGIDEGTSANNVVSGNYIGTTYTGTADLGNTGDGIQLNQADTNTIGGTIAGARNIISGNNNNGIALDAASSNTISGNYIGTNAAGTAAIAQAFNGIFISNGSANNTIGGTTAEARNIISGNTNGGGTGTGIATDGNPGVAAGTGNTVQGNYIGLGADGVTVVANDYGIGMFDINGMTVGGTTAGTGNVISGNNSAGINAGIVSELGMSNNTISGNYIGTDYTGTVVKGNDNGIAFVNGTGTGNVIGGTTTSARNIISGNDAIGVSVTGPVALQGNYIGLGSDGSPLGNGQTTASRQAVGANSGAIIGGTASGAGNIISAQVGGAGVSVSGTTPFGGSQVANVTIQGNCIGTNVNCEVESGYGNDTVGVSVFADVTNVLIGGTTSGAGNVIAGNGAGIANMGFSTYTPVNISILGNSIYDNAGYALTGLGIDNLQTNDFVSFINQGVTLNDADDIDYNGNNIGTNHYLNFPEITTITSDNGQATITYNLDINDTESGATGYRVEFYANDSADPSGYGQGQTYLGSDTVSGDVTNRQVTITLPSGVSGTKQISAVTTMTDNSSDGFGHSSEFGAAVESSLIPATPTPSGGSTALAGTGMNVYGLIAIASALIITGGTGTYLVRKRAKSVQ